MRLWFILSILCISFTASADESTEFKLSSLIRSGALDEARSLLETAQIPPARIHFFSGRIYFLEENYKKSIQDFKKSLDLKKSPETRESLAQVYLKNSQPYKAKEQLEKVKQNNLAKDLLYSQALWDLGQKDQAVQHLDQSRKNKYTNYDLIERQKNYYLYKMGRLSELFKNGRAHLSSSGEEVGLYTVSLLKQKDLYLAEKYFDLLLSHTENNALLLRERGVFELEKKRKFLSALYFAKAARIDPAYSFEAAAAFLQVGHHAQALFFNQKVKDKFKRLSQLFMIYLNSEDYEKALSLKYEMQKEKILEEEKFSYALMYAAFKTRDYKTVNEIFLKLTSALYVSKALKLKELIEKCRKNMEPTCAFS